MDDPMISVSDRFEIYDLLVDYCRLLDRMELEALAALFTEDCDVAYGDDARLKAKGRVALEASLARMWRWRRTSHHISNIRIWPDGTNRARAESYVFAWHEKADGASAVVMGRYLDLLVKAEERWRISQRRMDMNGSDQGFRVPLASAPRRKPPPGWYPPEGLDQ